MAECSPSQVEMAVALVTDANQQVLLVFHDRWGAFTVPTTRRHRGTQGNEPMSRAALRAAAEALGVPVRLVEGDHKRLTVRLQSGRQLRDKQFLYDVYHVEPHPDYADRLQVRAPHLWVSPHLALSGAYEPVSESARTILRWVLDDFGIPVRVQHTSVLIVARDHPERGRQYLLRRNPFWGYALPAKRWGPPESSQPDDLAADALAAAERVAREELGLEPGRDVILTPAAHPELTAHGVSATPESPAYGAATTYHHRLFDARLRHPEAIRSDAALAWVTEEEIHYRWTSAAHGESAAPESPSGRISRTVYDVLLYAGLIAEDVNPELEEMARAWLDEFGGSQG